VERKQNDSSPEDLLDGVGAAFGRLRRRTALVEVEPPVARKDLTRNLVINIVDEAEGEATVGGIAFQLSIDASVASRMVTDCVKAGLLLRTASQADGRRTVLELTPAGFALRDQFRNQHRQAFELITSAWPDSERLEFARLLRKYADATAAIRQPHARDASMPEDPD
jgi:DNA-binding MarR family transcriptional regulator